MVRYCTGINRCDPVDGICASSARCLRDSPRISKYHSNTTMGRTHSVCDWFLLQHLLSIQVKYPTHYSRSKSCTRLSVANASETPYEYTVRFGWFARSYARLPPFASPIFFTDYPRKTIYEIRSLVHNIYLTNIIHSNRAANISRRLIFLCMCSKYLAGWFASE